MKSLTRAEVEHLNGGRFPQRLVPAKWETVFVAGSVMQDDVRRAELLTLFGGSNWKDAATHIRTGGPHSSDADHDDMEGSAIWVGCRGTWIARYDAEMDTCLFSTESHQCLPVLDSVQWLTPGGALESSGFEPTVPGGVVAAMKAAYDSTSMMLCDEDSLARELHAMAAAVEAGDCLVAGCRRLRSLLCRVRLLFPPPAAVNVILQFVNDAHFWPAGDERVLWSNDSLAVLDQRRATLERENGDLVKRALQSLATNKWRGRDRSTIS